MSEQDRILSSVEVEKKVGLCRSTIYRMERRGDFPKRIKITSRRVGWRASEVSEWLDSRARAQLGGGAPAHG
jgi:prophage regulatory protein